MPEIVAEPPVPSCYSPVLRMEMAQFQRLGPDLFCPSRARGRSDGGGVPDCLFNFGGNSTCFSPVLSGGGFWDVQPEIGMGAG
jgi:hypothetical protein